MSQTGRLLAQRPNLSHFISRSASIRSDVSGLQFSVGRCAGTSQEQLLRVAAQLALHSFETISRSSSPTGRAVSDLNRWRAHIRQRIRNPSGSSVPRLLVARSRSFQIGMRRGNWSIFGRRQRWRRRSSFRSSVRFSPSCASGCTTSNLPCVRRDGWGYRGSGRPRGWTSREIRQNAIT